MDIQLKKGILEYLVLVVIAKEDSYGYQIVKEVSNYIEITESTLYPILKRLEQGEAVETYSVEHNSRLRKYYKITEIGKFKLKLFLEDYEKILEIYDVIKQAVEGIEHE